MSDPVKQTIVRVVYTNSYDLDVATSDVDVLNSLPASDSVPILREIYDHEKDANVRARAFSALLAIRDFDKVQFLIDILERSPASRHSNACYELRSFPDPRGIAKLCNVLLESPDPDLRYVAAESLAEIGDPGALPALEHARDHDSGEDFEGVPIADMARWAIEKISSRIA